MRNTILTLGLGAVLATSPALAERTGLYASASFGLNTLGDQTLDTTVNGVSNSGKASFDSSFAGGAAIGYRFANNFAVEGEFLYRRADLDRVDLGSFGTFSEGDLANTQFSVNGLYHFNLLRNDNIETYIGAGLAWINEIDIDFEAAGTETSFETDDIAVEFMAGARYYAWENAFIDVGLRYTTLSGAELESPADGANRVKSDYDPLAAVVKFGWRF